MRRIILLTILISLLAVARHEAGQGQGTNIASQGRSPADGGPTWSAYGTKTNTSDLQIAAAPGAGLATYIYMAYCVNSSASTQQMATITWGGTVRSVISCGPAAIYNKPTYFDPPLKATANTAVTMQGVGSATTTYLFAEGTTAR